MGTMDSVFELYKESINPELIESLTERLDDNSGNITRSLYGMGALILKHSREYLQHNDDTRRFRLQVRQTPMFELKFLEEAFSQYTPALLSIALGSQQADYTERFISSLGLKKESVDRLFSVASAIMFGLFGQYLRGRTNQSLSLKGWLDEQENDIAAVQPTFLSSTTVSPAKKPAVGRVGMREPKKSRVWLWLLLLLLLLAALLLQRSCSSNAPSNTTVESRWSHLGKPVFHKLADGKDLRIPQYGVENRLIKYIESDDPISDKLWFTFDRLLFKTNSSDLEPESQEQLQNIVDIMAAYPHVKLKLGGYTDNTGSEDLNLRLSQERADSVRNVLVEQGVAQERISAEGYGSAYPVVPNDSDEHRAQNRRIDIRILEK